MKSRERDQARARSSESEIKRESERERERSGERAKERKRDPTAFYSFRDFEKFVSGCHVCPQFLLPFSLSSPAHAAESRSHFIMPLFLVSIPPRRDTPSHGLCRTGHSAEDDTSVEDAYTLTPNPKP
jgi:hypothetical protein